MFKNLAHLVDRGESAAGTSYSPLGLKWKLMWLRGEIALQNEDATFAEQAFRTMCDEFLAQENFIDAALVFLRLAKVLLFSGKTTEMQEMAAGMMVLLDPLKLKNDIARAMMHELIKLALAGKVTEDFLDRAYMKIQQSSEWRGVTAIAS